MSKTYKDVPMKFDLPGERWDDIHYTVGRCRWCEKPGVKTKKKRHFKERTWMRTPMWWIHEFHQVPIRRKNRDWEFKIKRTPIEDLDLYPAPSVGRKPHWYYW